MQPGTQVGGEVARLAIVAGDDERGPRAVLVGERGQHVGPQRGGDERRAAVARERRAVRGVGEVGEERAQ